ncbi:MAG: hypothetical protein DHS20C21_04780 [Gemmatimonadota bacterium]|nr:MAG: hypothetical protein DHS20C21_04780 [Gemmatimonadota bacterium]
MRNAFVSEFSAGSPTFRTLAVWGGEDFAPAFEAPVAGTPCGAVLAGTAAHHPTDVRALFPDNDVLANWNAQGYCAVPVFDSSGGVTGHVAIVDDKPMQDPSHALTIMRIFAARAGAEMERLRAEERAERVERILSKILQATASATGEEFFRLLVRSLAEALSVRHAFLSEFTDSKTRVRTLAFWQSGEFIENFEYDIAHTPCEQVLSGEIGYYPERVIDRFPDHASELAALNAESYLAFPLVDSTGGIIGHLAVIHDEPMPKDSQHSSVFRIFTDRAVSEIERLRSERALQVTAEHLRDLFEEAPIAYVHEGLDTKFIRANRTAQRILGITADEVPETYGRSFIADSPEAQQQVQEALESVGRGSDTSGVILELRRRDNGEPFWIEWWSRPDPSGTYTRTMFLDVTDRVLLQREKARLTAHNVYLREELKAEHNFEEIVGTSPAIRDVFKAIEQVAPTDATVLITGETGTGKELIARAIHSRSARRDQVLVKVNCAAIPAGLIESELFGHEKGAFTGALTRKIGRFELADRATIFLDEVGELPLELQSKLLRVLQEGEFERLGSTETHTVDIRVIAATNRELANAVRDGHFRADLYYRLNVFPIDVPALRERQGDIPLLIQYFVLKYGAKMAKSIETISQTAIESMRAYSWPGNIRELENVIERALILSQSSELELGDWLPKASISGPSVPPQTLREVERAHIIAALDVAEWRVSGERGAAKALGLKPTTLEARMKKLGIVRTAS